MSDSSLVRYNARQLASGLLQAIALAQNASPNAMVEWRHPISQLHFHDSSGTSIAWNDVQAITMYNAITGENLAVPVMASEGYNQHGHTSDFDGGFIGIQNHQHKDTTDGGFAFAVYYPGVMPQQAWAI